MRKAMIATVGAAFILSGSAMAQAPVPPAPPAEYPRLNEGAGTIKTVSVIDMDALPAAAQAQVDQQLSTQSSETLQQIRTTIENEPELKSALAAKGFTSRDVVTAELDDDGELTIVAKRAT